VDQKNAAAVPGLRRLITAYLTTLPQVDASGDHPYFDGDDGVAALAHAMRSLQQLDRAGSSDLLSRYVEGLDREHATGTWELIGVDPEY
jgi:hypothetical protein